jgi:hypothetical protein
MSVWWRFWHIYRWRALARVTGIIGRRLERLHDRLHPTFDPECRMCVERWPDDDWPLGV